MSCVLCLVRTPHPAPRCSTSPQQDLSAVVRYFAAESGRPVALVGHSFGALLLMKVMEQPEIRALCTPSPPQEPGVAGLALLCSVPPVGNGPMVGRLMMSTPVLAWKITWGLAAKRAQQNAELCREIFFNKEMPLDVIEGAHCCLFLVPIPPATAEGKASSMKVVRQCFGCRIPVRTLCTS